MQSILKFIVNKKVKKQDNNFNTCPDNFKYGISDLMKIDEIIGDYGDDFNGYCCFETGNNAKLVFSNESESKHITILFKHGYNDCLILNKGKITPAVVNNIYNNIQYLLIDDYDQLYKFNTDIIVYIMKFLFPGIKVAKLADELIAVKAR